MSGKSVEELAAQHVLYHLGQKRPLFVAIQGPQGSGKSYLAGNLQSILESPPHSLRVAVLSIDDLYLPHNELVELSKSGNVLWKGRGQPGTHDVALGVDILEGLRSGERQVELPRFDKSLHNGEGDRLPLDGTGTIIKQPPQLDVVILEGWFVGFSSITQDEINTRWTGVWKEEREKLGLSEDEMGTIDDIRAVNSKLKEYEELWKYFDVFLQVNHVLTSSREKGRSHFCCQLKAILPTSTNLSQYSVVYIWRLEQERWMKSQNGGKGMSDAAITSFVIFSLCTNVRTASKAMKDSSIGIFRDMCSSEIHCPPWTQHLDRCSGQAREKRSILMLSGTLHLFPYFDVL